MMQGVNHEIYYQSIYSLSKKKVSPIFLPQVRGSECLPITEGWLCTLERDTGEINMLHPFSHKKIHLPSQKALLTFHDHIVAVSANANPSLTSDYVLTVHHNGADSFLAIGRPGNLDWTHIDVVNHAAVITSLVYVYHKGKFYSMSYSGKVRTYEVVGSNVKTRLYYLIELSGALLLVSRFVKSTPIHTFKFKVSELDMIRGELKDEMKTLGNSSMFPNHIYFADKWFRCSDKFDMGAYNLEDGKIESFYPGPSPTSISLPTWVMPSLIK
ncbi:hypothetical protein R3W88_031370 [Solanum pinnatisectum]|uniref:KIB1-4 beta-propeller domain-containing protein n=1 Tax=Solanum pinnatisectum TaxID=50273 RepID=A0AAV9LLS3_9SOLN|nr:hypothetical protein R3W88_031370 [Solanum pinnatisectum]